MIKETKETVTSEVITKTRFCDVCGEEIKKRSYTSSQCEICHRDICSACVGHNEDAGDYTDVYCKDCWELGENYRKVLEEHEKEEEQLHEEWYNKAIEKSKIYK